MKTVGDWIVVKDCSTKKERLFQVMTLPMSKGMAKAMMSSWLVFHPKDKLMLLKTERDIYTSY